MPNSTAVRAWCLWSQPGIGHATVLALTCRGALGFTELATPLLHMVAGAGAEAPRRRRAQARTRDASVLRCRLPLRPLRLVLCDLRTGRLGGWWDKRCVSIPRRCHRADALPALEVDSPPVMLIVVMKNCFSLVPLHSNGKTWRTELRENQPRFPPQTAVPGYHTARYRRYHRVGHLNGLDSYGLTLPCQSLARGSSLGLDTAPI